MKVISVINYKGGVGKTSVTANLGAELAFRGKKVLLIDLDPQCSLTFSFIKPDDWVNNYAENKTIKIWYDGLQDNNDIKLSSLTFPPAIVSKTLNSDNLKLISSHLSLINVDLELATGLGGANLKQSKRNYLKVHTKLKQGLDAIPKGEFDIVLIDCPPNFNIVTKTAIVSSEGVLIPAKPDYLSTLGIDYLIRSVNKLKKEYNDFLEVEDGTDIQPINPQIIGTIFTMVQIYGGQPIQTILPFMNNVKKLGIHVFNDSIRENKTLFADAGRYGVPVVLNKYNNPTHQSIMQEIERFVTEFSSKIGV